MNLEAIKEYAQKERFRTVMDNLMYIQKICDSSLEEIFREVDFNSFTEKGKEKIVSWVYKHIWEVLCACNYSIKGFECYCIPKVPTSRRHIYLNFEMPVGTMLIDLDFYNGRLRSNDIEFSASTSQGFLEPKLASYSPKSFEEVREIVSNGLEYLAS